MLALINWGAPAKLPDDFTQVIRAYFSMIRRASMAGANPADYTTAPISGGQPVVGAAQPRRGAGPPGLGLMRGREHRF